MSTLLHEIESYDACAASELKKAGFQSDPDIQTLTLEDLHELFPGLEKLKQRNTIFKIIHKQNQNDQFLEKLERDSLRGDVINKCLNRIKKTKEQLDEKQTVLKRNNDIPKDISKSLDSEKVCQPPAVPPPEPEELAHPEGDEQLLPGPGPSSVLSENETDTEEEMEQDTALQMEPSQPCGMETERYEAGAASVETEEDSQTDSVVRVLDREDLRELFPGPEYLKLRRTIFQIIHNQTPAHLLLEELKGFIQQNSFNDAPVAERIENTKKQLDEMQIVLEDLNILLKDRSKSLDSGKDAPVAERIENTKKQLDEMQIVIEAHNNMQNDRSKSLDSGKDTNASMTPSEMQKKKSISQEKRGGASFSETISSWFYGSSQKTQDSSSDTNAPKTTNEKKSDSKKKKREVRFKVEVSGQTFGADQQLLDKIKTPDLKWIEGEEHNITIVFCPVTSRVGTDAEAAMMKVPDGDPVILVLMHYSQEPKHVSSSKVLSSYPNVVLEVNIFYHNRKNGLLKCRQNENAVIELKKELKKYSRPQRSGFNHVNHSNSGSFS